MTNPGKCIRTKSFRVEIYDGFNLNSMAFKLHSNWDVPRGRMSPVK